MPPQSRILIVDDEAAGRETLHALLFAEGYELFFAASGAEAIDLARSLRPDLVLLDVMMPGLTGYDVCRELRRDQLTLEMPIIMVTALDDQESRLWGLEAGADDFISKPVNRLELRARVRTITRLNRYRQLLEERTRFERIVMLSPDGLLIVDGAGKVQMLNPALRQLVGLEADVPVKQVLIEEFFQETDRPALRDLLQAVHLSPGAPATARAWLQREAGGSLPVELTAGALTWHHAAAVQIVVRDISARLAAEQATQAQVDMLSALVVGAQVLVHQLDPYQLTADAARVCVEVMGADIAWLGRISPNQSIVPWNYAPAEIPALSQLRFNVLPTGAAAQAERLAQVFDLTAGELPDKAWAHLAAAEGMAAAASFPLMAQKQTLGVLFLLSRQPGFFTPARRDMFQAFANQICVSVQNAELFQQTQQRLAHIHSLHTIDKAIMASPELTPTLTILLEQATGQLRLDAAAVLLHQPHEDTLRFAAGRGFAQGGCLLEDSAARQLLAALHAEEYHRLWLNGQAALQSTFPDRSGILAEGFSFYLGVPLVTKNTLLGVLELYHRTPLEPGSEWFEMVDTLAGQAAIAVENATLFDQLQVANRELEAAYDATLEGWARALDLRDNETEGHTQRVVSLSMDLARLLGFPEDQLVHIWRGALLHDMGKLGVPDHVLLKPGPLTPVEWRIMRRHPEYAFQMLSPIRFLRPALVIPLMHHEHWDGSGYPQGLRGEQIPLAARMFTLVDVWDALRSDRPYRRAWTDRQTVEYIRQHAGTLFDPALVPVFLQFVRPDG